MFSSIIIAYFALTFFMASRFRPDNFLFDRMLPLLSILNLVQVSLISWNLSYFYLIISSLWSTTWRTSWSPSTESGRWIFSFSISAIISEIRYHYLKFSPGERQLLMIFNLYAPGWEKSTTIIDENLCNKSLYLTLFSNCLEQSLCNLAPLPNKH